MGDEHKNEQERRVSLDDMPAEVRQLADAMLGVNPQWNVHDWLIEQAAPLGEEQHPSNIFLDLLPNANTDDPLLAIACQSVIIGIELEVAKGEPLATLQAIFAHTRASNIDDSETDEALDYLLTTGMVIEIDDDCFILLPS